jgi:hypothetical protein
VSAHPAPARSREPPPLQLFSQLSHHPCTGRTILYTHKIIKRKNGK